MRKKLTLLLFLFVLTIITIPTAYANRTLTKCKYTYFSELYGNSSAIVTFWESPDWGDALYIDYFNGVSMDENNENIDNGSDVWGTFVNTNYKCPYYLYLHKGGSDDYGKLYYDKNKLISDYPKIMNGSNRDHILVSESIATDFPGYDRDAQGDNYDLQGSDFLVQSGKTRIKHCIYNSSALGWTSGVFDLYQDSSGNLSYVVYAPVFGGAYYNDYAPDSEFSNVYMTVEDAKTMISTGTCPYFLGLDEDGKNEAMPTYTRANIVSDTRFETGGDEAFILVSKTIEEDMAKNGAKYDPNVDGKYKYYEDVKHKNFNSGMKVPSKFDWNPDDPYQFHVGDNFCGEEKVVKMLKALGNIIILAKFVIPMIIVIIGVFDLIKVVTSGKEDVLKKQFKNLGYRVVVGLFVFFVPSLTNAFFSSLSYYAVISDDINQCQACLLNPNDEQYCEYWVSGTNFTPTVSINAPVQSGTKKKTSRKTARPEDVVITSPSIMGADEKKIRDTIISVGREAIEKLNPQFVYLNPSQRNDTGCLKDFFNGKKCTTVNKTSCSGSSCTMYGTDCNGFVGYVYHQALGITNDSEYRFASPDKSSKTWTVLGSASKYFKVVGTVADARNNISQIEAIAKPGDMLGRYCVGGDSHTHVGIYAGNGKVIENRGGSNPTCLTERSIEQYIRITDQKCNVTVITLYNFDSSTYK